jgi:hypothetical protein
VADTFGTPAEYDIPELPAWQVSRPECGGIAFAADGEPFIAADHPVSIRR